MKPLLNNIDHINIVVIDLQKVADFFLSLGFEEKDRSRLNGEWISSTVGLDGVDAEYVRLALPGNGCAIELIRFDNPPMNAIPEPEKANTQGLRHLAFRVSDIGETVAFLKTKGIQPISAIQKYSATDKQLVYFNGPEGILLELAQYG